MAFVMRTGLDVQPQEGVPLDIAFTLAQTVFLGHPNDNLLCPDQVRKLNTVH